MMNDVIMPRFDWLVMAVMAVAYFLPSIIGAFRGVRFLGKLFLMTLFLAWTFFALAALILLATVRMPAAELDESEPRRLTRVEPRLTGQML